MRGTSMKSAKKRWSIGALWLACLVALTSLYGCVPAEENNVPILAPTEEEIPTLSFDGRRFSFSGQSDAIAHKGSTVTIVKGGQYRLSGTLKEGNLTIDVAPDERVHLLMDHLSITASSGAPLKIENGACVILESTRDSINLLCDTASEQADSASGGVIESAIPIIFRGEGSLILSGKRACGIESQSDILQESGSLTISAPQNAMRLRDCFTLVGGRVCVTEATRGIAVGESHTDRGEILMTGGDLVIQCSDIALTSTRKIVATGGRASLRCRQRYVCALQHDNEEIAGNIEICENWLLPS